MVCCATNCQTAFIYFLPFYHFFCVTQTSGEKDPSHSPQLWALAMAPVPKHINDRVETRNYKKIIMMSSKSFNEKAQAPFSTRISHRQSSTFPKTCQVLSSFMEFSTWHLWGRPFRAPVSLEWFPEKEATTHQLSNSRTLERPSRPRTGIRFRAHLPFFHFELTGN